MSSHTIGRTAGAACLFDPASMASEFDDLRMHAQKCQHARDPMFWTQCAFEKIDAYLGGRIITLFVFATLMLLILSEGLSRSP